MATPLEHNVQTEPVFFWLPLINLNMFVEIVYIRVKLSKTKTIKKNKL